MPTYTGQPYQPSESFLDTLYQLKQRALDVNHFNQLVSQLELTRHQRQLLAEFYESVLNELA